MLCHDDQSGKVGGSSDKNSKSDALGRYLLNCNVRDQSNNKATSNTYFLASQSKQTSFSLFVQYCFPHTLQVVFRIKSLFSRAIFEYMVFLAGKLIALLWQRGAQAEQRSVLQPPPHLAG